MGIEVLPPGVSIPINNGVTFPGQLLTFDLPINNNDPVIIGSLLISAVRVQASTIEGVFNGMVNIGGTLVPTPVP